MQDTTANFYLDLPGFRGNLLEIAPHRLALKPLSQPWKNAASKDILFEPCEAATSEGTASGAMRGVSFSNL